MNKNELDKVKDTDEWILHKNWRSVYPSAGHSKIYHRIKDHQIRHKLNQNLKQQTKNF